MSNLLFKIAKDLQIGTSTIVEHLKKQGFEIDNKPNAKLNDDMLGELSKQFQASKVEKEKTDAISIGSRPKAIIPEIVKRDRPTLQISQNKETEASKHRLKRRPSPSIISSTNLPIDKLKPADDTNLEIETPISNQECYDNFITSVDTVKRINGSIEMYKPEIEDAIRSMLYANIITCLEVYLADSFIDLVRNNDDFLIKFAENSDLYGVINKRYKDVSINLKQIFTEETGLKSKIIDILGDVIWHRLDKEIKPMFKKTLGIDFLDTSEISKSIQNRHSLVHKNGKLNDGTILKITKEDITKLCEDIKKFVDNINTQVNSIRKS